MEPALVLGDSWTSFKYSVHPLSYFFGIFLFVLISIYTKITINLKLNAERGHIIPNTSTAAIKRPEETGGGRSTTFDD